MMLIILGAGASFDSVTLPADSGLWTADRPYRPPLARQLFEDREGVTTRYLGERPALGAIANEVRASVGHRDVEEVLADLVTRPLTEPIAMQLVHLRYYLRNVVSACTSYWAQRFGGATHHAYLVDLISRDEPNRGALLVTFNYDLMIEWALEHLGYEFASIADYTANPMKLIKLHGSTNWGRVAGPWLDNHEQPEAALLRDPMATIANLGPEIVVIRGTEADNGRLLLPALAVPAKEKDTFECPAEHVQLLVDSLPSVRRLLVIGWRGADPKLLSLIADRAKGLEEIQIVSDKMESAAVTAELLRATGIVGDYRFHADGFSGLMRLAGKNGRLPSRDEFQSF